MTLALSRKSGSIPDQDNLVEYRYQKVFKKILKKGYRFFPLLTLEGQYENVKHNIYNICLPHEFWHQNLNKRIQK